MSEKIIIDANVVTKTPSSRWYENDREDFHKGVYDCERHELDLGDLTDDELANDVFLFGNSKPAICEILAGTAKMPIVYLTAAKERIRWLSRQNNNLSERVAELEDKLASLTSSTNTAENKS
ncbi:hypothetical protein [Photobacterium kishitanii]|uniref:hypothetical protein n=1 Tax=Photobacterium kishitanii TaxID=318456 RepID=UPI0011B27CE3|nr:hypothetical protein [Photobacterium kishitanii]